MPTRILRRLEHADMLADHLRGRKMPITVSWQQGAPRTGAQNRLAFQWYNDISRQLGDQNIGEARAECKVNHAAPILCRDNPAFAESWQRLQERLSYEEIVKDVETFETPMTRAMTTKQMTEYLDAVQRHYSRQGVRLTDPEMLRYQEEFGE